MITGRSEFQPSQFKFTLARIHLLILHAAFSTDLLIQYSVTDVMLFGRVRNKGALRRTIHSQTAAATV